MHGIRRRCCHTKRFRRWQLFAYWNISTFTQIVMIPSRAESGPTHDESIELHSDRTSLGVVVGGAHPGQSRRARVAPRDHNTLRRRRTHDWRHQGSDSRLTTHPELGAPTHGGGVDGSADDGYCRWPLRPSRDHYTVCTSDIRGRGFPPPCTGSERGRGRRSSLNNKQTDDGGGVRTPMNVTAPRRDRARRT